MMGAQSAYAAPAFQTGFNHGVSDATIPNDPARGYYGAYINQTGKGLDHHSVAFGEGYIRGWCEVKQHSTLFPHANSWAPDIRCQDILGVSLIFSTEKKYNIVPSGHHLTDTEQEAGIATDKIGRVCNEGPNHDECHDQFLERTNNLPTLPSNQHYGECEEDSKGLACDILNDDGTPNPGIPSAQSAMASQGYWTSNDSNIPKGMSPYHIFLDETYPSSLNRQTMLLNQNLTACLDFNVNYTKPNPLVCHHIKESEIPRINSSILDVGYFVVSDKLNATNARACIQTGYQNWYNCDGQMIDANSYYTNTKILADLGPTYDDIKVHDACLTYHHLKEGTDEFNECEKELS